MNHSNVPSVDGELGSNQSRRRRSKMVGEEEEEPLLVITPTAVVPRWNEIQPLLKASSSLFLRSIVLQLALAGGAAMAARTTLLPTIDTTLTTTTTTTTTQASSASVAAHQIALQLWLLGSFICDALA